MANNAFFRAKNGVDIRVDPGTAPIITTSDTLVVNLNTDLLDDQHGSYYLDLTNSTGILAIARGGTGAATPNGALNALLPNQTGNSGKFLGSDGVNGSWTNAVTSVSTADPAAGITITGGPITTVGTLTFSLANDLAALEALSGVGFAYRTGVDTWTIDTTTYTAVGHTHAIADITNLTTELDGKVSTAGDTMDLNANITFNGGEVLGLPSTPSGATAAASKAYVDTLVASSATWKNPVLDSNIVDVVSAIPGAPLADTTFIKYGGVQNETWGTLINVVDNDIVSYTGTDWIRLDVLSAGNRFIIAGEHGTIGATLLAAGFVNDDIIQYVSGDPTLFASWTLPEGRGQGGTPGSELGQGTTVLVNNANSLHFGHTYLYDAVGNEWVEISGPGSVSAGAGLSYSGSVLNINFGAGVVQLPSDEVGIDTYASGGLFTTVDGTTLSTLNTAQLSVKLDGTSLALSASGLSMTSGVVAPGTYQSVTVDTYGRITFGTNPTTLSGYGITDAVPIQIVPMNHGVLASYELTTTSLTQTPVLTFATSTWRVVEFLVQASNTVSLDYQGSKILLVHDNTTPIITEYGQVQTGTSVGSFDADISSGQVRLLFTPTSTSNTVVRVILLGISA